MDVCSEISKLKRALDGAIEGQKISVDKQQEYIDNLTRDIDRLKNKIRESYHENDRLADKLRDASRRADRCDRAVRREERMEELVSKLESDISRIRAERDSALVDLKRIKDTSPTQLSTSQEILGQMEGMESEMKMMKEALAKHRGTANSLEENRSEVIKGLAEVKDNKGRLSSMQKQLRPLYSELNVWVDRYNEQLKVNHELKLFVELSHEYLGVHDKLEANLKEEISKLHSSALSVLETRLTESMARKKSEEQAALNEQIVALQTEVDGLKEHKKTLMSQIEALKSENTSLREDSDAFWTEMDNVSDAYEASREQNAKLMKMIVQRDEDNSRLLSEAAEAERKKALMEEEKDDATRMLSQTKDELKSSETTIGRIEKEIESVKADRDSYRSDMKHKQAKIDSLTSEIQELNISLKASSAELEVSMKHLKEKEEEMEKHLEALKGEKTRADRAEAILAGKKTARSNADEEESAALRKMVNCSVCSTRLKDRMITKCNHLFCSVCIDANLSSRHRKCPGCGERFGAGDVKPFYFT